MTKLYAFELSGEHPTIPKSEALALLEMFSSRYREIATLDRCLLVEVEDPNLAILSARLAMTHRIVEASAVVDASLEALMKAAKDLPMQMHPYRVRAKRLVGSTIPNDQVERKVGSVLWERGYKADLKNPEIEVRAFTTEDTAILGLELVKVDRGSFQARRPHLKPFFHPGAMGPRMARALVNLAQVRSGERLLDPFSGTGGFLVEAGLMGLQGVGVDAEEEIVRGAMSNLSGIHCSQIMGDAKRLPLRDCSVEGVVSDAPYGRSARIQADSRDELLARSLEELHRVLVSGRQIVFVDDEPLRETMRDAGFEVIDYHRERVHRSLTRHIHICRK